MKAWLGLLLTIFAALEMQTSCPAQASATTTALNQAWFKAASGQWLEAIEHYQRIMETAGDELTPVPPPYAGLAAAGGSGVFTIPWRTNRSLPARWIVHEHISRWPVAGLSLYRERFDKLASERLVRAAARPDDRGLEQVVGDWFNCRAAEQAIAQLAQRAFDRGEFAAARYYWKMLLPGSERRVAEPHVDRAGIAARVILARLFEGDLESARRDLANFRKIYPRAAGLLAGCDGPYADTLQKLLTQTKSRTVQPAPDDGKVWPTFANHSSRDAAVSNHLPFFWPGAARWKIDLPTEPRTVTTIEDRQVPDDHPAALAFHPVVAAGRAFLADAHCVYAIDLLSGERSTLFDERRSLNLPGIDGYLPVQGGQRFTLTYADSFLYARFGSDAKPRAPDDGAAGGSAIVCLGPITDEKNKAPGHAWTLRPPKGLKEAPLVFNGAPLVHDNKLFVVLRQPGSSGKSVACYQLFGADQAPELLWRQEAVKSAANAAAEQPAGRDLLTWGADTVVLGTQMGQVVALDANSGKPVWEFSYPSVERRNQGFARELCPCLCDGEHLFAAPADTERLYCLDARSGRPIWDIENIEIIQLLGVAKGRLIATVGGAVRGIRGIDAASGSQSFPDGWVQHDDGGVATHGRGFVTPELIFWPTRHGLQFLRPEDGSPVRQPVPSLLGNLVFADGCFVAAGSRQIQGFVCEGKLQKGLPAEAPGEKDNPFIEYRRGRAAADAGRWAEAAEFLNRARNGTDDSSVRARRLASLLDHDSASPSGAPAVTARICYQLVRKLGEPVLEVAAAGIETASAPARKTAPETLTDRSASAGPLKVVRRQAVDGTDTVVLQRLSAAPEITAPVSVEELWAADGFGLGRLDGNFERRLSGACRLEGTFRVGKREVFFGPDSVLGYATHAPTPDWSIQLAQLQTQFPDDEPGMLIEPPSLWNGRFSGFHRSNHRLYTILEGRVLLAFDIESGRLLWRHWVQSPRSLSGPGAVVIRPCFHADERFLLLQLSSGRIRIVDARDGRTQREMAGDRQPWVCDPIAINAQQVVYAEDAQRIVCLDLGAGQLVWRQTLVYPTSLCGRLPQLRPIAGLLIVRLERNIGVELMALEPRTGRNIWPRPAYLSDDAAGLEAIAGDATRLYIPSNRGLLTVATAIGNDAELFIPVPESHGPWGVVDRGSYLILYPMRPTPVGQIELGREVAKMVGYLPTFHRIGRVLDRSYHSWRDRALPLLVYSRSDGRLLQRIELPAAGLLASVQSEGRSLAVTTGAGFWRLEEQTPP